MNKMKILNIKCNFIFILFFSFVFPRTSRDFSFEAQLGNFSREKQKKKQKKETFRKPKKNSVAFCMPPANPFKEDIKEFQVQ